MSKVKSEQTFQPYATSVEGFLVTLDANSSVVCKMSKSLSMGCVCVPWNSS